MSTYSINNYLISQDLTRYAKQVGKDGNYTLGHCIVEYIEQADRIFTPELKVIDTSKAYDLIDLDQDCGFKGRVAIQETKERELYDKSQAMDWIGKLKLDGDVMTKVIDALEAKGIENNNENFDFEYKRQIEELNTPKNANVATVAALVAHTSKVATKKLESKRLANLAKTLDVDQNLATAIVACDIDKGIINVDGVWKTDAASFHNAPSEWQLNSLVDKALLTFDGTKYLITDMAKQAVRENYL